MSWSKAANALVHKPMASIISFFFNHFLWHLFITGVASLPSQSAKPESPLSGRFFHFPCFNPWFSPYKQCLTLNSRFHTLPSNSIHQRSSWFSHLQACSCQNVFYSYYESSGSGQTTSTEVKSVAGEECAYQLPYMVVMRPTNHPPTTLGLQAASQAANIYMEIEPGDAIAPLSAPPRPSSAPGPAMLENSPAGSSSILLQQKRRAEGLPGLSPIQIAFNETGQQFLHLNIQPGQERSKLW